jgi:6,7-dimethyl-8-ribityllumazine synthase
MGSYETTEGSVDGSGMRVAIVVARFNHDITKALLDGAERALEQHGVADVRVVWVPGAFELPLVAKRYAASEAVDAVICLGAVIRGDTAHFDFVAGAAMEGILRASLDTEIPVVFGVLTTDTLQQAYDRVGGTEGHKGEEAALTAVEMVDVLRRLPAPAPPTTGRG